MSAIDWPLRAPHGALDVVGIGAVSWDHVCVTEAFPARDATQRLRAYATAPGGSIPTALAALARWGALAAFLGAVGDDLPGVSVQRALCDAGVDCAAVVTRADASTQTSVVLVDARSGERAVLWHRLERLQLSAEEVAAAPVARSRALVFDASDVAAAVEAGQVARAVGIPVLADVEQPTAYLDRLLPLVDVLLVSWPSARALSGADTPEAALMNLARGGHAVVGVTLGAEGAMLAVGEHGFKVPALPVSAVDTTGAGALFRAGVVWGLLDGLDLAATLRFATAAAALQCTRVGAWSAIPSLPQVRALAA